MTIGWLEFWKSILTARVWSGLSEEIVAIQRLALLQAAGEPLPTGGVHDQLPADASVRVALIRAAMSQH